MLQSKKFENGLKLFEKIHGGLSAQRTVDDLKSISPKLAEYSIEWIFGDLYADTTIDMKTREISNISALVATDKLPQLRNHIYSAYHLGFTRDEIEKIILNTLIIVGFPSVVNAVMVLKDVFDEIEKA